MPSSGPVGLACGVVVTGPPASGKSTVGRGLATLLPGEFLSLDAVKEELFEETAGDLTGWPLRQAAEERLEAAIAACAVEARIPVVDVWVEPGRDERRVASLLRQRLARVVEVMCQVPAEVAVERFFARSRGGPHDNDQPGLEQRIRSAIDAQRPLGVDACQVVDTTEPVDLPLLTGQVRRMLPPRPGTRGPGPGGAPTPLTRV